MPLASDSTCNLQLADFVIGRFFLLDQLGLDGFSNVKENVQNCLYVGNALTFCLLTILLDLKVCQFKFDPFCRHES